MNTLLTRMKYPSRAIMASATCALIVLIVVIGFGPSYVGAILSGHKTSLVLHFHAVVFIGWIALFTLQALLPAFGRVDLHKKIGQFGIAYAILLVVVGLTTTVNRVAYYFNDGQEALARAFLIAPLSDMIVFPIFFTAAILFRHKPNIHKRLMLVATVSLTIAAVARMSFLPASYWSIHFIWLSPIYLAMGYDLLKHRMIHPAYIVGILVLAIVPLRDHVTSTDAWGTFFNWFITTLT